MDSKAGSAAAAGYALERRVASIFRALGAKVEHDVPLAGNQIDVVVREEGAAGTVITTAIECKAYTRPVGVDVINAFGGMVYLLKQRSLIDRAMVVSTGGFTRAAREAASAHGLDLLELDDLEQRVAANPNAVAQAQRDFDAAEERAEEPQQKRAFVVMPFAPEFQDVYILGIRDVAERLRLVVEHADSIEHNGEIIDIIREKIRTCDVVVADTTGRNPYSDPICQDSETARLR
jgi:hypothetical protein